MSRAAPARPGTAATSGEMWGLAVLLGGTQKWMAWKVNRAAPRGSALRDAILDSCRLLNTLSQTVPRGLIHFILRRTLQKRVKVGCCRL